LKIELFLEEIEDTQIVVLYGNNKRFVISSDELINYILQAKTISQGGDNMGTNSIIEKLEKRKKYAVEETLVFWRDQALYAQKQLMKAEDIIRKIKMEIDNYNFWKNNEPKTKETIASAREYDP